MSRPSATARRRFRATRGPKPATIIRQYYEIEITEFREPVHMAAKVANVIEWTWPVTATLMITDEDIRRNPKPDAFDRLLAARVQSATISVEAKCDEMLRACWGSLLPRRRTIERKGHYA